MSLRNALALTATVSLAGLVGSAKATTVATFADPTTGPTPSLFQWDGTTNTLTAGWSGLGLDLLTPGTLAPNYTDATFTLTPLVGVVAGPVVTFGAGSVQFFDNAANPVFTINFNSATMLIPQGFGSSAFVGAGVTFSGPALGPVLSISNEAFSFSFANLAPQANGGFTATSAFTSSADIVIPTPGAMAMLATAGLCGLRRRRR
ncbi:MAG: hypothetical protein KF768_09315 [Phycisphaeraceae bacterium]|nr:hypothetical protein [Phycisphaeraceae bacterium]